MRRRTYRKRGHGLKSWWAKKAVPWLRHAGKNLKTYIKNKHFVSRGVGFLSGLTAGALTENPLAAALASKGAQYATQKATGGWGKKSRGGSLGYYHSSSKRTPRVTYGKGKKKKKRKK